MTKIYGDNDGRKRSSFTFVHVSPISLQRLLTTWHVEQHSREVYLLVHTRGSTWHQKASPPVSKWEQFPTRVGEAHNYAMPFWCWNKGTFYLSPLEVAPVNVAWLCRTRPSHKWHNVTALLPYALHARTSKCPIYQNMHNMHKPCQTCRSQVAWDNSEICPKTAAAAALELPQSKQVEILWSCSHFPVTFNWFGQHSALQERVFLIAFTISINHKISGPKKGSLQSLKGTLS